MMPPKESIAQWAAVVSEHLPELSLPQAKVLAEWSYAVQALQRCGQSQVSQFLALVLDQSFERVRQRIREWTWEKGAKKKGKNRREVDVAACFASLLKWVLSGLPTSERRLVLALDATSLKQTFVVLSVSVLYRGCAIPVAWQVRRAQAKGAWRPHWLRLLRQVHPRLPTDWQVLVMADRGLFADWLVTEIRALGWHPFLRINSQGLCRPAGTSQFQPLLALLPAAGQTWRGKVTCFKSTQLEATLLVYQDDQHEHPWLILTDLPPDAAEATWYEQRAWIEGGFKDIKGGGWQRHLTRMTQPERAERLWLVLAVAQMYSLSLGSQVQADQPAPQPQALPPTHVARRTAKGWPPPRRLSLVTLGQPAHLARLVLDKPLPSIRFKGPNSCPVMT
jgi:Transposase DDE domain